jgi:hypothetical protein
MTPEDELAIDLAAARRRHQERSQALEDAHRAELARAFRSERREQWQKLGALVRRAWRAMWGRSR